MSSFRDQVTFSGDPKACESFTPNKLRPEFCSTCMQKIFSHSSTAVKKEEHIKAALEYCQEMFPTMILTTQSGDSLYLGGYKSIFNLKHLLENNIKRIANTAKGLEIFGSKYNKAVEIAKEHGIEFLNLPWVDTSTQVLTTGDLERGIRFIYESLQETNSSVLVHCAQGRSRSSSLVVAYCMIMMDYNYLDALKRVKEKRLMAQPNRNFQEQLTSWYKGKEFLQLQLELNK